MVTPYTDYSETGKLCTPVSFYQIFLLEIFCFYLHKVFGSEFSMTQLKLND